MVSLWRRSREARYARVEDFDWEDSSDDASVITPTTSHTGYRRRSYFTARRMAGMSAKALLGLAAGMVILMLLVYGSTCEELTLRHEWDVSNPQTVQLPALTPGSNSDPKDLKFRMILPADNPGPNLCKTIFSATANGYPSPVIVNFGREFEESFEDFGLSHLAKIDGTRKALDALLSEDAPEDERMTEDDIVAVIDAYDVWFQLPPEVLIRRFHEQNAIADARLDLHWTPSENDTAPAGLERPSQRIIVSAQKKCWPGREYGEPIRCDMMPVSPVQPDLYGTGTDSLWVHERRPRYLNSGGMIGTAGAMRRYFAQAEKLVAGRYVPRSSDQYIFALVMGEQQVWRARVRDFNADLAAGRVDPDSDEARETMAQLRAERDELEFGIGLDYVRDLFPPTIFSEYDGEYVHFQDQDAVRHASVAHGVYPPRIDDLPPDVSVLPQSPLAYAGLGDDDIIDENGTEIGWARIPLYTDFFTSKVPVTVHHNGHKNGMKQQRLRDWWELNWFFPYLRRTIESLGVAAEANTNSSQPLPPGTQGRRLATIKGRDGDLVYRAPPSDLQKPLARLYDEERFGAHGLEEAPWNTLCGGKGNEEWWNEIFRDEKGSLRE